MLKNILGSIVFTAAVFALVNFIGDVMVNPATAPHPPRPQAAVQSAPKTPATTATSTATTPATTPAPAAQETAAPVAAQAVAAMVGDAAKGKKVFRRKCLGCHTIDKDEANRTGPNLWAIIDKAKGGAEGYRYSKSMKAMGGVWSEADLMAFIAGPRTFLRDTKMTFAGLKKEQDRVNIIAYFNTMKD